MNVYSSLFNHNLFIKFWTQFLKNQVLDTFINFMILYHGTIKYGYIGNDTSPG